MPVCSLRQYITGILQIAGWNSSSFTASTGCRNQPVVESLGAKPHACKLAQTAHNQKQMVHAWALTHFVAGPCDLQGFTLYPETLSLRTWPSYTLSPCPALDQNTLYFQNP